MAMTVSPLAATGRWSGTSGLTPMRWTLAGRWPGVVRRDGGAGAPNGAAAGAALVKLPEKKIQEHGLPETAICASKG